MLSLIYLGKLSSALQRHIWFGFRCAVDLVNISAARWRYNMIKLLGPAIASYVFEP